MLDNLRNETSFQPEEEEPFTPNTIEKPKPRKRRRSFDKITGTTGPQRFMLSLMLLVMVCLLGVLLLLVTRKVVLPF